MNMTLIVLLFPALCVAVDPLVHVGSLTAELRSPARVAVGVDGAVYVTDPFLNRIVRYDADGALIGTWAVPEGPIGIGAHPDGTFYVSLRDEGEVGIYVYDDVADTFTRTGYLGDADPMVAFVRPTDIDIAPLTGRVFVVDSGQDRWYLFNPDGALRGMGGVRGELMGEFKYPSAIAVDEPNNRMLIADHDNFRVQVFMLTDDGDFTYATFMAKFGYRMKYLPGGDMEGWLLRPQGMAVDAAGQTYLTDALMGTVRVFDATGTDLGKVIEYGSDPGDLRTPCDIALSPDGSLVYVVSTGTGTVEIYNAAGLGVGRSTTGRDVGGVSGGNGCIFDRLQRGEVGAANRDLAWHRSGKIAGAYYPDSSYGLFDAWAIDLQLRTVYDGPHMVDGAVICGRCHGIAEQPGGHLGLVDGQVNLCVSCHSSGGQAMDTAIREAALADPYGTNPNAVDGHGTSHAWGVDAVNVLADSVGPLADGDMALYLDEGRMKCTTCHQQHNSDMDWPYLRVLNDHDQMCKECHAPRNEGPGELGTHVVGFDYPGGVGEFPSDGAIAPMHLKDGNVECMTCHAPHWADSGGANSGEGDGMLLRAANDKTFCQTCHTEHIIHTPSGDWQPTCADCHDVHDPDNENLSLVGATVHSQTLGADKPVVFTAHEGANSFNDGDPGANDGICQVCHTATNYHMHDGGGALHNEGQDCTICHPHDAGFMPTGGDCTACHSTTMDNGDGTPAGGRRAVVGEFPEGDAHAHYGVELNNDACTVCHSLGTHMDGYIELIDPDDGSIYRFVWPEDLSADPDVSDFCARCHDADGAMRLGDPFDPFGGGNTPPDVATQFLGTLQWDEWYGDGCFGSEGTARAVNSHHDISTADQTVSGAKIECLSCHGAHTASAAQPLADPFNTLMPWTGDENGFCLACHYGGSGPADPDFPAGVTGPAIPMRGIDVCIECVTECCEDGSYNEAPWWMDYSWTNETHGLDSKRGWAGYSDALDYVMGCTVCHDPHGSYTPTNTLGNPYMIRDVVDGTSFVDDGYRPGASWTGPPWDTFGIARPVVVSQSGIDVDWGGLYGGENAGLCNVCHADWLASYDWHAYCTGCQTCHNHGQSWGGNDWGGSPDDSTHCGFPASCGNGTTDGCEECDTSGESGACDDDCTAVLCGDGNVNEAAGEQCDDGNTDNGDGCSAACLIE